MTNVLYRSFFYQRRDGVSAEVLAQVDEQAIAQSSEVHALTTAIQQEREGAATLGFCSGTEYWLRAD